jgi:hypothetical protein
MTRALSSLPLCFSRGGAFFTPQTKGIHMVRKCLQHSYKTHYIIFPEGAVPLHLWCGTGANRPYD